MHPNQTSQKSGVRSKIAGIVIVLLSICLVFNIVHCVQRVYRTMHTGYLESNASAYEYYFRAGDYPAILDNYERCVAAGIKNEEDALEYIAVAQYYKAASLYHAAQVLGDGDTLQDCQTQLEEALSQLHSQKFLDAAKQIEAQFDLAQP